MNVYENRRGRALEGMADNSLMLLYSGEAVPGSLDEALPFRANSHLFYLTGLRRENAALLLLRRGDEKKALLFIEEPKPELERWTGRRLTKERAGEISGIGEILWTDELEARLSRLLARNEWENAYFDCYRNSLRAPDSYNLARAKEFAAACPGVRLRDAHPMLTRMRLVKDEGEIAAIREAADLTRAGLERVMARLAPGMAEYPAQAEFEYEIRMRGAEGTAFATIAGSGANGCLLHYEENEAVMREGQLLLMDLGAAKGGYRADVTRTFPVSGRYSARQREIYGAVLAANLAVREAARPGLTLKELNDVCRRVLAERLAALGLVRGEEELSRYYMHSVSHHLGIDTHDAALDGVRLAPGMVITDEPGLYIDEEETGVRIEDDLLITERGCLCLTDGIPREAEAIEAFMAEHGRRAC